VIFSELVAVDEVMQNPNALIDRWLTNLTIILDKFTALKRLT